MVPFVVVGGMKRKEHGDILPVKNVKVAKVVNEKSRNVQVSGNLFKLSLFHPCGKKCVSVCWICQLIYFDFLLAIGELEINVKLIVICVKLVLCVLLRVMYVSQCNHVDIVCALFFRLWTQDIQMKILSLILFFIFIFFMNFIFCSW